MFCIVGKLHLLGNHLFSWAYTFKFMVFLKRYFGTNLICGYQCIHKATTGLYICYHKHTLLRWLKKSTKNSTPQILMIPKYCTWFKTVYIVASFPQTCIVFFVTLRNSTFKCCPKLHTGPRTCIVCDQMHSRTMYVERIERAWKHNSNRIKYSKSPYSV